MKIICVTHDVLGDPFWRPLVRGLEDAASRLNVVVEHVRPERYDLHSFMRVLDQARAGHPDGMLLTTPQPEAQQTILAEMIAAGTPVIVINTPYPAASEGLPRPLSTIVSDDGLGGRTAAEVLLDRGIEHALCVDHYTVRNVCHSARADAFRERFEEDGGSVEIFRFDCDEPGAPERLARAFDRDPAPGGVLSLGPPGFDLTRAALRLSGREGGLLHVTFDLSAAVLDGLEDGSVLGALDCQQYLQGYLGATFMALHLRETFVPPASVSTGPVLAVQESVRALRTRMAVGRG